MNDARTTAGRPAVRTAAAAGALALAAGLAACSTPAAGTSDTGDDRTSVSVSSSASWAAPTLTMEPQVVNPGEAVTITGEGWFAHEEDPAGVSSAGVSTSLESVDLILMQPNATYDLATVEPVDGAFEVTVTVPDDAVPGNAFVRTADSPHVDWDAAPDRWSERIVVLSSDGTVPGDATPACVPRGIASPDGPVRPGDTITVVGAGFTDACAAEGMFPWNAGPKHFTPEAGIEVWLFPQGGAADVVATVDADANGEWSTRVTLPEELAGDVLNLSTSPDWPDAAAPYTSLRFDVVRD